MIPQDEKYFIYNVHTYRYSSNNHYNNNMGVGITNSQIVLEKYKGFYLPHQRQNRTDLVQNEQYYTNMGGKVNIRPTSPLTDTQ